MSKGTFPIITCDHEDGCSEFTLDWYEATADNWRALMPGWEYDPYRKESEQYCPEHAKERRREQLEALRDMAVAVEGLEALVRATEP